MCPGLIAFTRMRLSRSSFVQVRAKDRTAALVALYTLMPGKPLVVAIEAFRIIDPPSLRNGSPFWTEKNRPLTFASKWRSKNFSSTFPKGACSAIPAFAKITSSLRPYRLTDSYSRSRSFRLATSPRLLADFSNGCFQHVLATACDEYMIHPFQYEALCCC